MGRDLLKLGDGELFSLMSSDEKHSEEAFAELYTRYSPRVFAYCRRFMNTREEAEDVFQEIMVRFYQSRKQERDMTNIPAFILKIAHNICVNVKRRAKHYVSLEDFMTVQNDNRTDKDELLNLIKMALDLLSAEYREIFVLREYDGLSYADISDVIGIPITTVKIRLFRAKERVREILAPYLEEMSKTD